MRINLFTPDRANGRQSIWHSVFHCQKSKLRTWLKWNNVRSEVIYERVVEAMALPVRVVNCGTAVRETEQIHWRRRRRRKRWRRRRGSRRPKFLTLFWHDFFMLNTAAFPCQFLRLLDFFATRGMKDASVLVLRPLIGDLAMSSRVILTYCIRTGDKNDWASKRQARIRLRMETNTKTQSHFLIHVRFVF